ncbi:hypothetical protein DVH24_035795 [Malus domestica]|uniref:Uncharacterized protein n=1 Tax=Malus domestica TaxID=3750 RepID=A0A498JQD1_MALDO|nr:hypothetical protein DVH24_035795 [Malus domestica]
MWDRSGATRMATDQSSSGMRVGILTSEQQRNVSRDLDFDQIFETEGGHVYKGWLQEVMFRVSSYCDNVGGW